MTHQAKFNIVDTKTGRRMYLNMIRDEEIHGYSWGDGYGFVTDSQVKSEKWKAVSADYPGTDVPVSSVLKLDVMRLESRIEVLENRKASHGLAPHGEELLTACKQALTSITN